jgi:ectoine hydroxylase-related dioxygenase (phytanoyl-CoA dioxygenase family)
VRPRPAAALRPDAVTLAAVSRLHHTPEPGGAVRESTALAPFTDSSDLLDEPEVLRERFADDGYLFLRGVVDPDLLLEVRRQIVAIGTHHRWWREGTDPIDAIPRVEPRVEGERRFFHVYDEIQRLEAFHAVPHDESVRRIMVPLLGESVFPHPLSIARLVFPDNDEWSTPPHQDYPNNQGTFDLYACWLPLGPCPVELGSLSLLRGSHKLGLLPLTFSLGAGHRRAMLDERHDELDWVGGDFALGDAVVFHSLTVHRSLPNRTDRLRLSVDYRFQREGEPLTEECLEPHFARLSWDEIYQGWTRRDLQYYWREKRYEIASWDPELHELSDEEFVEWFRAWMLWRGRHPVADHPDPGALWRPLGDPQ